MSDRISQAQDIIASARPELAENRMAYEAILLLYSGHALIETQIADLGKLIKHKKIEAYHASARSFKECALNLLDEHPELTAAKGMLRYYEAPDVDWQECEKAEIAIGDALAQDVYGWLPDCWTAFKSEGAGARLTVVAGY